ncbi:unnamed protein product, partial [Iphiclides podalirius]
MRVQDLQATRGKLLGRSFVSGSHGDIINGNHRAPHRSGLPSNALAAHTGSAPRRQCSVRSQTSTQTVTACVSSHVLSSGLGSTLSIRSGNKMHNGI